MEVIKRLFTPEFRNRLDAVVQFGALSPQTIASVVDKFLFELEQQLLEKKVALCVDAEARTWLASHGYDPRMGARPMARVIREQIKKPLANELLFGQLVNGGKVWVKSEGEGLTFEFQSKVGAEKLEIA
jgi:ATP-dependent Clp protease ATP-binding subunit ClpA